MRGVPIRAVQDLMGHASIVITQRYAHLMPGVSHEAVRLLDAPSEPAAADGMTADDASSPARVKTSREIRAERATARVSAKNRQEIPPAPVLN
jgi:hypothetical protein